MIYLTVSQVKAIHGEIVNETGGSPGIRDSGLLESAVIRPQMTFEGKELYPDIFMKAAILGFSLINNHPFVDANKRTGYLSMEIFLSLNGFEINASEDDAYDAVLKVASHKMFEEELSLWLKEHSISK